MVPGERLRRSSVNHCYPLPTFREFCDARWDCRVQAMCRMDLFARARELGIETEFVDGQGRRHVTDAAALKIILEALPAEPPRRILGRAVVVRSGRPARSELGSAARLPVDWKIVAG